ncbi:MAG TPA: aldehyde dehydrogenase family protein [Candidatus Limnocylindrales bacterium]|nr:aldehyde dehydrogenase family protein [Candidatus Limnocylindrales bacterium]
MQATVDNPSTGEVAATFEMLSAQAVEPLLARAQRAAGDWRATPLQERVDLCSRFLQAFDARAETIARELAEQMGKPLPQGRGEVRTMRARAEHMMAAASRCLADAMLEPKAGFERRIQRVPVGIVLDIAAWNYPLLIAINVVVPAVLSGNAVILKHSRRTPSCARHFEEAFAAAGAPDGLVAGVVAEHGITAAIVSDARVGYVAFTGSVEGGRAVSRAAAGRFIDVGLELGGKDAAYVRSDVDIAAVAEALAEGAFYNSGQSCCAVERIYVDHRIYADFVDALTEAARAWKPGDPLDERTMLGPMAQADAVASLQEQLDDAVGKGARVTTGGNAVQLGGRGRWFEATVAADTNHSMTIATEESFGPVVAVAPIAGDEEAIRQMNDSRYGLTASIWSRDVDAARRVAPHVEAGTIFLNRCDFLDPALPWSGWKDSGVGVTLSDYGFDRMTKTRAWHFRLP